MGGISPPNLMDEETPPSLILSIIYYSGGTYSPDELIEIVEIIKMYEEEDNNKKRGNLRVVETPTDKH